MQNISWDRYLSSGAVQHPNHPSHFVRSFIHSFILNLLSTYHVSGTVLGTVDLVKNKGDQNPCSQGVQTLALDLVGAQILADNKHSVSKLCRMVQKLWKKIKGERDGKCWEEGEGVSNGKGYPFRDSPTEMVNLSLKPGCYPAG